MPVYGKKLIDLYENDEESNNDNFDSDDFDSNDEFILKTNNKLN